MRMPPLNALEAVKTGRVDNRVKRLISHYRAFFRCFDRDNNVTEDENEIARVELTQRGKNYYAQNCPTGRSRLPPV